MTKLKPCIKKKQGFWELRYRYPARSFALFGFKGIERERIAEAHIASHLYVRWEDAITALQRLYIAREIA